MEKLDQTYNKFPLFSRTPTSEKKVEKSDIEETVMKNGDPNQRLSNPRSLMGGQMIMLQLLRHMQRNRRRRRVSTVFVILPHKFAIFKRVW